MSAACLLVGGDQRKILVRGEVIHFEDHPRLGPCPTTPSGRERTLGPRHAFWRAATRWIECGREVGSDGLCVWSEEPDPREGMVRIGNDYFQPEMLKNLNIPVTPPPPPKRRTSRKATPSRKDP